MWHLVLHCRLYICTHARTRTASELHTHKLQHIACRAAHCGTLQQLHAQEMHPCPTACNQAASASPASHLYQAQERHCTCLFWKAPCTIDTPTRCSCCHAMFPSPRPFPLTTIPQPATATASGPKAVPEPLGTPSPNTHFTYKAECCTRQATCCTCSPVVARLSSRLETRIPATRVRLLS